MLVFIHRGKRNPGEKRISAGAIFPSALPRSGSGADEPGLPVLEWTKREQAGRVVLLDRCAELLRQPGAGVSPMALRRGGGHPQGLRRFLDGRADEVAELRTFGLLRVPRRDGRLPECA